MLFSFFGTDIGKVRASALLKLAEIRGDGEVITLSSKDGSLEMLKDALGSSSLFGVRGVYLLDTPSEDADFFASVCDLLPELRESENAFVLIEGSLKAAEVKKIEKESTEAKKYDVSTVKEFNVFALCDALIMRDKKTLWILLQEAWKAGKTSEEIIGTLWWQLKILRLAARTHSAEEAGQKPFAYDKAKRGLRNFKEGEVEKLSHNLLMLYHDGHGGVRNIDHALEAWVLGG